MNERVIDLGKTEKAEKVETAEPVASFTKDSIMRSQRFSNRRDALSFLLKDDESYTLEQVEGILNNFYNESERVK